MASMEMGRAKALVQWQWGFGQAGLDALANGPDGFVFRHGIERCDGEFDQCLVELAHQALIGAEYHCDDLASIATLCAESCSGVGI